MMRSDAILTVRGGHGSKSAGLRGGSCASERRRSGFTMTELLAVIAIMVVAAAVAFVAISGILKGMQQAELDGTAREIFIAAQNHLTTAEAQGTLEAKPESGRGTSAGEEGIYYFAVGDAATRDALNRTSDAHFESVLYEMLPYGSIDETVRMDGTYVIKYDYSTATVLGVFYARSNYSSLFGANTSGFTFTDADYPNLFPGMEGEDRKEARQSYASASGPTVMIGYYGGDDLDKLNPGSIPRPKLQVRNAERLVAVIRDVDKLTGAQLNDGGEFLRPTVKLIVTGDESNAQKAITLVDKGTVSTAESYVDFSGNALYVYLDDVTERGGHFAEIFGGDGFLPGEDLTIQAVAFSTTRLANVAQSAKVHRNSLFASLAKNKTGSVIGGQVAGAAGGQDASGLVKVANIRHLENLSANVSGYDPGNSAWGGEAPTSAQQTRDLSWPEFQGKIVAPADETPQQARQLSDEAKAARQAAGAKVSTVELWNYAGAVNEGSFMPVSPNFKLSYDGKSNRIAGVRVSRDSGNVGVFGDLTDANLHDVALVNCSISTLSGDAAALAGALNGTSEVSNVVAFNEPDADGSYAGAATDAALEIRGTSSVGGLVGSMWGGTIQNSAAAVYARSTGGSAGGLLGWTVGSTSIRNSYAGGHTLNGAYSTGTAEGEPGRVNVIAAINAGGLVGNAAGASALGISNCYSTASTFGNDLSGGLVGYLSTGSVTGSYVAAPVNTPDGVQKGAFVGGRGGSVSFTGNAYVEMLNPDGQMNDIGAASSVAADADMASYSAFADGTDVALPYDATLMSRYSGTYPFKTVARLAGDDSLPWHARAHYGDWPALETLVVNVPQ